DLLALTSGALRAACGGGLACTGAPNSAPRTTATPASTFTKRDTEVLLGKIGTSPRQGLVSTSHKASTGRSDCQRAAKRFLRLAALADEGRAWPFPFPGRTCRKGRGRRRSRAACSAGRRATRPREEVMGIACE